VHEQEKLQVESLTEEEPKIEFNDSTTHCALKMSIYGRW
jgi:hypothetical protein